MPLQTTHHRVRSGRLLVMSTECSVARTNEWSRAPDCRRSSQPENVRRCASPMRVKASSSPFTSPCRPRPVSCFRAARARLRAACGGRRYAMSCLENTTESRNAVRLPTIGDIRVPAPAKCGQRAQPLWTVVALEMRQQCARAKTVGLSATRDARGVETARGTPVKTRREVVEKNRCSVFQPAQG